MSTEDPKGPEAPARRLDDQDQEEDAEGHAKKFFAIDPNLGSDKPSKADESDDTDDTEGHRRI